MTLARPMPVGKVTEVKRFNFSIAEMEVINGFKKTKKIDVAIDTLDPRSDECLTYYMQSNKQRKNLVLDHRASIAMCEPFSEYVRVVTLDQPDGDGNRFATVWMDVQRLKLNYSMNNRWNILSHISSCIIPSISPKPTQILSLNGSIQYMTFLRGGKGVDGKLLDECLSMRSIWMLTGLQHHHLMHATERRYLEDLQTSREEISEPVILGYVSAVQNGSSIVALSHPDHASLVSHIYAGLQRAMAVFVGHLPQEEQTATVCGILERVFHIKAIHLPEFLTNQLRYRTAMYKIVRTIMCKNGILCASHSPQTESSTHAPLPLMAVILWRIQDFNSKGFALMGHVGGIFQQLQDLMMLGKIDRRTLEDAYGLSDRHEKLMIDFSCTNKRRRRWVTKGQQLLTQFINK